MPPEQTACCGAPKQAHSWAAALCVYSDKEPWLGPAPSLLIGSLSDWQQKPMAQPMRSLYPRLLCTSLDRDGAQISIRGASTHRFFTFMYRIKKKTWTFRTTLMLWIPGHFRYPTLLVLEYLLSPLCKVVRISLLDIWVSRRKHSRE